MEGYNALNHTAKLLLKHTHTPVRTTQENMRQVSEEIRMEFDTKRRERKEYFLQEMRKNQTQINPENTRNKGTRKHNANRNTRNTTKYNKNTQIIKI